MGDADEADWWALVEQRRDVVADFLQWAAACEAGGPETSPRIEHRDDVIRCREVLPLFPEPWWAVVVYSCFDSTIGARAVADRFREPLPAELAEQTLAEIELPRGSVQHSRAQVTSTGARRGLVSACAKASGIHDAMTADLDFGQRYRRLTQLDVAWWGRTTCYDALLRAGILAVAGSSYRPDRAYLRGSKRPAAGFERVWGIPVTARTSDRCEQVLHQWTAAWHQVAAAVDVAWPGPPYDSGDLENALCAYLDHADTNVRPLSQHLADLRAGER